MGEKISKNYVSTIVLYEDPSTKKQLKIEVYDICTYLAPSQPTGTNNLTFPSQIMNNDLSINYSLIDPDSDITKLFKPNSSMPPLPALANKQQDSNATQDKNKGDAAQ